MNNSWLMVSVVPRLYPAIDGVGDYALSLARQLRADFGIETHFVVGDSSWVGNNQLEGFHITKVTARSAKSLLTELARANSVKAILLHYVGYGYAKRGCPFWLVEGLENWVHQHSEINLVTMFHEISASGPAWTSAFWLSAAQRYLVKRLFRLSDRILTSKQLYADILQDYSQGRFSDVPTLPVFSTVGEPSNLPDLSARQRHLVIFGGQSRRNKVYKSSLEQLHQICQCLNIQQIFDIGPKLDSIPTHICNVPITATGSLSSHEVSAILSGAFVGFFNYHPAFLGKSTIFAAYCAHRVLPVSAQMTSHVEDGLYPGRHYILPNQYSIGLKSEISFQAIADNACNWYQTHCLVRQAQVFATYICKNSTIRN
ncbi:glycosyltransferase family 1 protein [Nodosilinea sp. LEGE 07298]|uniref:glycosyltransferase family 1 protein n=1 Tax=Nodosilinea sp. LEGE 07298 TaxID=2777970 RepID=UPI00188295AE|nr:glycosyltransferase family 1 protein [Nodosilinea sp. LEGE 07298]MBE9109132.1 glycosyltransferase family 1 protein [Nodosilinea sp. LEGE 07298]